MFFGVIIGEDIWIFLILKDLWSLKIKSHMTSFPIVKWPKAFQQDNNFEIPFQYLV